MAVDKLVDSSQLESDLTSVANAIRTKGGTSASLSFPSGFVTAIGNISTGTPTLKMGVIRPDATVVKTISYDKLINQDEGVTIPSYSTSSTNLKASASLTAESYTVDLVNYNYYVLIRALSIPLYNVSTKAKGRVEYVFTEKAYEVVDIEPNYVCALVDGTTKVTTRFTTMAVTSAFSRVIYWYNTTSLRDYSSTAYGPCQSISDPTINTSDSIIAFSSPSFNVRGHATYFTSTYFNALTDIRYQYKIEVYRATKGNLNLDGWGMSTQVKHIIDCAQSNTHTLT